MWTERIAWAKSSSATAARMQEKQPGRLKDNLVEQFGKDSIFIPIVSKS
jgi:hypothetical protein